MATTENGDSTATKVAARKRTSRNTSAATAGASKTSPAAKKAAPVRLTDGQRALLARIHEAGATGYEPANKNEQRSVDALQNRKLLKRGSKNKQTGNARYLLTKAGQAHLPTA